MAKAILLVDLSQDDVQAWLEDMRDPEMSPRETIFEMVSDAVRDGVFDFKIVSDPLPGMDIIFEYGKAGK